MTKFFLILFILLVSNISKSQIKALTENGREVLLFENGTWKFLIDSTNSNIQTTDSLIMNKNKFYKASSSTFLVKSNTLNIGVFINPAKWTFRPHRDNEKNPEYFFSSKSFEGYVMMVTEKTQIELGNMRQIALMNAQRASVDVKETNAEYRTVNDKKVLCLTLEGTIKGIKFVYLGYYYSSSNGTVQLIGYTSLQYFDSVKKELENFLNGLVETDK